MWTKNISDLAERVSSGPDAEVIINVKALVMSVNVERLNLSDDDVVTLLRLAAAALARSSVNLSTTDLPMMVERLATKRGMPPTLLGSILAGNESAPSSVNALPVNYAAVPQALVAATNESADQLSNTISRVNISNTPVASAIAAPTTPNTRPVTITPQPTTAPVSSIQPSIIPTPAPVPVPSTTAPLPTPPPPSRPTYGPVHPAVIDAFTRYITALYTRHRVNEAQVQQAQRIAADLQAVVRRVLFNTADDTIYVPSPKASTIGSPSTPASGSVIDVSSSSTPVSTEAGSINSSASAKNVTAVIRNDPGLPLQRPGASAAAGNGKGKGKGVAAGALASPLPQQQLLQQASPASLDVIPVPSPVLHIFGSLVNGFGTFGSDVDVALQLSPDVMAGLRGGSLLEGFHDLRRRLPRQGYPVWQYIQPGRSSVPLLRLTSAKAGGVRVDLGFNNSPALHNTRLLATYAALDDRVAPLGIGIKLWAKARCINDASNHFLSSYAFILLAIWFLQQPCTGPILPVLQDPALIAESEASTGKAVPVHMVELEEGKQLRVQFVSDVPWLRERMRAQRAAGSSSSGSVSGTMSAPCSSTGAAPSAATAEPTPSLDDDITIPPEGMHVNVAAFIPGVASSASSGSSSRSDGSSGGGAIKPHDASLGALFIGLIRWLDAYEPDVRCGVISVATGKLLPRDVWVQRLTRYLPVRQRRRKATKKGKKGGGETAAMPAASAAAGDGTPSSEVADLASPTPHVQAAAAPAEEGGDEDDVETTDDEGDDGADIDNSVDGRSTPAAAGGGSDLTPSDAAPTTTTVMIDGVPHLARLGRAPPTWRLSIEGACG